MTAGDRFWDLTWGVKRKQGADVVTRHQILDLWQICEFAGCLMHGLFELGGRTWWRYWSETGRLPTPFKLPTCRRSPDRQPDELQAKERIIATSRDSNQDKLVAAGEMANYGSCYCWWPELILPPSSSLRRRTRCHCGPNQLSSLRYGGRGRPRRLLGLNGPVENAARRLVGHFLGTYATASLPCKARGHEQEQSFYEAA